MSADYPRDLIGYASNPPHPQWPGEARIALSFVLNYEEGGFLYDSDTYDDDLPYWDPESTPVKPHLVIPYTLDTNDMRFTQVQGFNKGDDFYQYLKDAFDVLYAEGCEGAPKMLSIGMHCRLLGRPARLAALQRFVEYAKGHDKVWFARRVDIARHWHATHPMTAERN